MGDAISERFKGLRFDERVRLKRKKRIYLSVLKKPWSRVLLSVSIAVPKCRCDNRREFVWACFARHWLPSPLPFQIYTIIGWILEGTPLCFMDCYAVCRGSLACSLQPQGGGTYCPRCPSVQPCAEVGRLASPWARSHRTTTKVIGFDLLLLSQWVNFPSLFAALYDCNNR
jgi:hypothetical protein